MRRYASAFLVLGLIVVLSGCAATQPEKTDAGDSVVQVRGRLEAAEVTSFMYGDYLLYDETRRQLYALKASNGDLRDYEGQRVRVSGVPVPGYPVDGGPPYLEVRTIRRLGSRGGEHERHTEPDR